MLETMQNQLSAVKFGDSSSVKGNIDAILTNDTLFGVDLKKVGLSDKVEGMLAEMIAGPGAVRATLKKYLG